MHKLAGVTWAVLATAVDLIHAASMAVWLLGLPVLFVRSARWRRARRGFAYYAIGFVVVSQASQMLLGECFLTTLVRPLWERGGYEASSDWFTVRLAQLVFGMIPSHRAISRAWEALVVVTAAGVLYSLHHDRRERRRAVSSAPGAEPRSEPATSRR